MGVSFAFAVLVGICIAKLRQLVPPVLKTSTGIMLFVTGSLNVLHHTSVPAESPDTGHWGNAVGNSFTGVIPSAFVVNSKHLFGLQSMPHPDLEYRAYAQSLLSMHDLKHASSVPFDGNG